MGFVAKNSLGTTDSNHLRPPCEPIHTQHAVFNTGFAGAKVVVDASRLNGGVAAIDKTQLMSETSELLKDLEGTMFTGW